MSKNSDTFDYTFHINDHDMVAQVTISGGHCGSDSEPPSGPDIEFESKKVMRLKPLPNESAYYFRTLIYMVRGKKRRLLPAEVADAIESYLIQNEEDDILESCTDACTPDPDEKYDRMKNGD